MNLYVSVTSPFARKVRVTMREYKLEVKEIFVNPYEKPPQLILNNPAGKVPTLLDNDQTIIDSTEIFYYLQMQYNLDLFKNINDWDERRKTICANEIITDALLACIEKRKNPQKVDENFVAEKTRSVFKQLQNMEKIVEDTEPASAFGITLGVALYYLDFRHPQMDWRKLNPKLSSYAESIEKRPAFTQTKPPLGAF